METAMKRLVLAAVMALIPLMPLSALAPAAAAEGDWCDDDPVVVIVTPGGHLVPLFNTMGVQGLLHAPDILLARVSYTTKSVNGGRSTQVNMKVTIPNDLFGWGFPTRAKISTGPLGTLNVLGTTSGNSGSAMNVQFTIDVP
jgi:hypothetical protein